MKIEEIEKLNAERTQGIWQLNDQIEYWDIQPDIVRCGYEGEVTVSIEDANFIAAAPTITEQYIKARRFVVTQDFVEKVHDFVRSRVAPHRTTLITRELWQTAFDEMWKEIEATHDQ